MFECHHFPIVRYCKKVALDHEPEDRYQSDGNEHILNEGQSGERVKLDCHVSHDGVDAYHRNEKDYKCNFPCLSITYHPFSKLLLITVAGLDGSKSPRDRQDEEESEDVVTDYDFQRRFPVNKTAALALVLVFLGLGNGLLGDFLALDVLDLFFNIKLPDDVIVLSLNEVCVLDFILVLLLHFVDIAEDLDFLLASGKLPLDFIANFLLVVVLWLHLFLVSVCITRERIDLGGVHSGSSCYLRIVK